MAASSAATSRRTGCRPKAMGLRSEPFTLSHPRLTPDREAIIRRAVAGTDPRGSRLPAWMVQSLLAEVDALRGRS